MDFQAFGTMCNDKALRKYESELAQAFSNSLKHEIPSTIKTKKHYPFANVDLIYQAACIRSLDSKGCLLEMGRLSKNSVLFPLPQSVTFLISLMFNKHCRLNFHDFDQKFIVALSGPSRSTSPSGSPASVRRERRLTKPKTWFQ